MKELRKMTQAEVAAYVQNHLKRRGITVVLSGGAAVAIYSLNKYVSRDIDLVNSYAVERKRIRAAMEEIGFREIAKYFHHPQTSHIVEFPTGPLAIDDEPVEQLATIRLATGNLRLITATDCVRDRLAAYYFWDDRSSLEQAVLVACQKRVSMTEIRKWSTKLGMLPKFESFRRRVAGSRRAS